MNFEEYLDGRTVLVTGGAGFIGSHLCERLLSHRARVICFDNLSTGNPAIVAALQKNKNFTFIRGDVNKLDELEAAFLPHRVDYIFHYAALVGVKRVLENPQAVFDDIEGIKNIASLAERHAVKKIIFASSSEVYGDGKILPFSESGMCDVRNPYSTVKMFGETYFANWSAKTGIPATSLRFFNVYGPRQESSAYGFVIGIFIQQALSGKSLTVFNDGKQTRDFTFVDDNIEAALRVLTLPQSGSHIFNIGTGIETSIKDLALTISAMVNGSAGNIEHISRSDLSAHDSRRRVADIRKIGEVLGFAARVSLAEGLEKTMGAYTVGHGLKLKRAQSV